MPKITAKVALTHAARTTASICSLWSFVRTPFATFYLTSHWLALAFHIEGFVDPSKRIGGNISEDSHAATKGLNGENRAQAWRGVMMLRWHLRRPTPSKDTLLFMGSSLGYRYPVRQDLGYICF